MYTQMHNSCMWLFFMMDLSDSSTPSEHTLPVVSSPPCLLWQQEEVGVCVCVCVYGGGCALPSGLLMSETHCTHCTLQQSLWKIGQ